MKPYNSIKGKLDSLFQFIFDENEKLIERGKWMLAHRIWNNVSKTIFRHESGLKQHEKQRNQYYCVLYKIYNYKFPPTTIFTWKLFWETERSTNVLFKIVFSKKLPEKPHFYVKIENVL